MTLIAYTYKLAIGLAKTILPVAGLFSTKLKKGITGRKNTFKVLKKSLNKSDKTLWFHCASLGEYEQGLPVFTYLRNQHPEHKIVLSFFSPSGYEIRKNSPIADIVVYLPLDTTNNAKKFLTLVNPELSVFVKYELWPNFLNEMKTQNRKAILISAVVRESQPFFKSYGSFFRNSLNAFSHIFTQDENSEKLLKSINFNNVTIAGDTRFDRVNNQLKIDNTLDFINQFKNNKKTIVIGSAWPEDEAILIDYINAHSELKFIVAPHNINSKEIANFKSQLQHKTILFSNYKNENLQEANVFIIDTIGILTKIYSYADIAYVGGAMGTTGLHNILEPAVFGVPVIFGENHSKFPEAQALINNKSGFSVNSKDTLKNIIDELITDNNYLDIGKKSKDFITRQTGATQRIKNYLDKN